MADGVWWKVYGLVPFALNVYDTKWHLSYLKDSATKDDLKALPDQAVIDAQPYFRFSVVPKQNVPAIRQEFGQGKSALDFAQRLLPDFYSLFEKLSMLECDTHVKRETDAHAYLARCMDSLEGRITAGVKRDTFAQGKTRFSLVMAYAYLAPDNFFSKIDALKDPAAKEALLLKLMTEADSLGVFGKGYDIGTDVLERALPVAAAGKNAYSWDGTSLRAPLIGLTLTPVPVQGALPARIVFEYGAVHGAVNPSYVPVLQNRLRSEVYAGFDTVLKGTAPASSLALGNELVPASIQFFKSKSGAPAAPHRDPPKPAAQPPAAKPPAAPVQASASRPVSVAPVVQTPKPSGPVIQIGQSSASPVKEVKVINVVPAGNTVRVIPVSPASPTPVTVAVKQPVVNPAPQHMVKPAAAPVVIAPAPGSLAPVLAEPNPTLDSFYKEVKTIADDANAQKQALVGASSPAPFEDAPKDYGKLVAGLRQQAGVQGKPKQYYADLETQVNDVWMELVEQGITQFEKDLEDISTRLSSESVSYDSGRDLFQTVPGAKPAGAFDPDLTKQ